ncbi:hypothetical protein F4821DRAFT_281045 [Hypoxylon rubiginosum]|uniref:Uncharacterized protein n=1 Tax=Hypoxylon rubiginosum TaxID=110542 RepID=A0ACC0CS57_9PEZI|nr:hypothetical protein F4821DRAFT_281045 [Hypoxylon rubiginosum]
MARLREELSAYYKGAGEDQDGEIYVAIAKLRELASLFEEEGLYSLELSLVYVEQAQLFAMLGDDVGRRDKIRKAVQIRLLCLGTDHPSSAQLSRAIEREIRR